MQQKSNFKNLLLEKKLSALADTLEKKVSAEKFVSILVYVSEHEIFDPRSPTKGKITVCSSFNSNFS